MKLEFIDLGKLSVSKANMRYAKKAPDISDILPTVRKRGVLMPVLVRPNGSPGTFEIVAGARRFHAARVAAEERRAASGEGDAPECEQLPCAILDEGDDAAAIEASLIENIARLDPDEVTQWETFTRLVKEGQEPADIAATFGMPDLAVRRVLALGNLMPRIRELYRREAIDRTTVRHLTLASKSRQRDWLAVYDDPEQRTPTGHGLKAWLFGGQTIPVRHALFDTEGLAIVADLFGEDAYFTDADLFWARQDEAIAARRSEFLAAGWTDVVVVPRGEVFHAWEHEKAAKRKGGRVYVDVRENGEVIIHEGYVSRKEARAREKGETADTGAKPVRAEVTTAMQTYLDLHRHAAVRAAMIGHPALALRLMVAHAVTGSPLWTVRPEPQSARNDDTAASVAQSIGEAAFAAARLTALRLLGLSEEETRLTGGNGDPCALAGLFLRLVALPDRDVLAVLAVVMGETLMAGSVAVDALGAEIGIDMADYWQADDAFLSLIRDREVLSAMVGDVAGSLVAEANAKEKAKTLKQIVRDHLDGSGGRSKAERWVPRWLAFPPAAYTARGGVGSVAAHALVEAARAARAEAQAGDEALASPASDCLEPGEGETPPLAA